MAKNEITTNIATEHHGEHRERRRDKNHDEAKAPGVHSNDNNSQVSESEHRDDKQNR